MRRYTFFGLYILAVLENDAAWMRFVEAFTKELNKNEFQIYHETGKHTLGCESRSKRRPKGDLP